MNIIATIFGCGLALAVSCPAAERLVRTPKEFDDAVKAAQPGDHIVLADGEWAGALLKFRASGTPAAPIVLRAQTPGAARLTGNSRLRMGGDWLVAEGLWFHDPATGSEDVIEFRADSRTPARHSRLTQCAVTWDTSATADRTLKENRWISIYGASNRVDHCLAQGKVNRGATLVVWLDAPDGGRHRIEHNRFGPRPRLGVNGGETIRIGDSSTSLLRAECLVEQNLFDRCDGEAECVSNKSGGNLYRRNLFERVAGALTLRHGDNCVVEENVFLGAHAPGTGGIRVVGAGHVIRGNHLEALAGDDERGALTLMLGIPNSPLNGYAQVRGARFEDNRLVDCRQPLFIGLRGAKAATLAPMDTVFLRNQTHAPKARIVQAGGELGGVSWSENVFWGRELGMPDAPGVAWRPPSITRPAPLPARVCGPAWWSVAKAGQADSK